MTDDRWTNTLQEQLRKVAPRPTAAPDVGRLRARATRRRRRRQVQLGVVTALLALVAAVSVTRLVGEVGEDEGSEVVTGGAAALPGAGPWRRLGGQRGLGTGEVSNVEFKSVLPAGRLVVGGALDGRPAIWVLEEAEGFERPVTLSQEDGVVQTLVAAESGALIAGGFIVSEADGLARPAIWRSDDGGTTWHDTSVATPSFTEGVPVFGEVKTALAHGAVLYAGGALKEAGGAGATIWRSTDGGREWTVVALLSSPAESEVRAMTVWGDALVAVGESRGAAVVWTDASGPWERTDLPGDGSSFASDVGVLEGQLVVVGSDVSGTGPRPRVWVSRDTQSWTLVEPTFEGATDATDLVIAALVVDDGVAIAGGQFSRSSGGADGAAWASRDLEHWELVGQPLGGEGNQSIVALRLRGKSLVAVGWEDVDGGSRPLVAAATIE